jgi:hypothetical protein
MSRRRSKAAVSDSSIRDILESINAKLANTNSVAHLSLQQHSRGASALQSAAMSRTLAVQFGSLVNELLDCESTDSSGNVKRAVCLCAGEEVLSAMIIAFNPKQNAIVSYLEVVLLTTGPRYRDNGYARLMLCLAADMGVAIGAKVLIVDCTIDSESFWRQKNLLGEGRNLERSSHHINTSDCVGVIFDNAIFLYHKLVIGHQYSAKILVNNQVGEGHASTPKVHDHQPSAAASQTQQRKPKKRKKGNGARGNGARAQAKEAKNPSTGGMSDLLLQVSRAMWPGESVTTVGGITVTESSEAGVVAAAAAAASGAQLEERVRPTTRKAKKQALGEARAHSFCSSSSSRCPYLQAYNILQPLQYASIYTAAANSAIRLTYPILSPPAILSLSSPPAVAKAGWIFLLKRGQFQVGQKIEAEYMGRGVYYPGTVTELTFFHDGVGGAEEKGRGEGSDRYNIKYEDEDEEEGVEVCRMRRRGVAGGGAAINDDGLVSGSGDDGEGKSWVTLSTDAQPILPPPALEPGHADGLAGGDAVQGSLAWMAHQGLVLITRSYQLETVPGEGLLSRHEKDLRKREMWVINPTLIKPTVEGGAHDTEGGLKAERAADFCAVSDDEESDEAQRRQSKQQCKAEATMLDISSVRAGKTSARADDLRDDSGSDSTAITQARWNNAAAPSVVLVHYFLQGLEARVPTLFGLQTPVDDSKNGFSGSSRQPRHLSGGAGSSSGGAGRMSEEEIKVRRILQPCKLAIKEEDVMVALIYRAGEGGYDWRCSNKPNGAGSNGNSNTPPDYLPANGCRKSLPVGKLACRQHEELRRGGKCHQDTGPSLSD